MEKKPAKSELSKPPAVTERNRQPAETRKFNVLRKRRDGFVAVRAFVGWPRSASQSAMSKCGLSDHSFRHFSIRE